MIVTMHSLLEEGTAGELVDALQPVGEELREEAQCQKSGSAIMIFCTKGPCSSDMLVRTLVTVQGLQTNDVFSGPSAAQVPGCQGGFTR